MAGGFVDEPRGRQGSDIDGTRGSEPDAAGANPPLLALTSRQESRLRTHLDDRLLGLERDERKQAFASIPTLLDRLFPLLYLILQIPPVAPWADLRISYLLTYTGYLATYITSLPLLSCPVRAGSQAAMRAAAGVMQDVLDFLAEVEKGWAAVLGGEAWVMETGSDDVAGGGRRGHGVPVDFAGSIGQTERTRLRSIIIASRAKFLAWARAYGSFPGSTLPPTAQPTRPSQSNGSSSSDAKIGRTMGCDGVLDPDPPTAYERTGLRPVTHRALVDTGEWEDQILGMWNAVLEALSEEDFGPEGSGR